MKLFAALASLVAIAPTAVVSHGTEVRWCVTWDKNLRIFVEHWHGDLSSPTSAGTLTLGVPNSDDITKYPDGLYNNVNGDNLGLAHGCREDTTTLANTCNNEQNDWVYFDFTVGCGGAATYTLLQGNTVVLTEDCSNLYPTTITGTAYDFSCVNPGDSDVPSLSPSSHQPSMSPSSHQPSGAPSSTPTISPSMSPSSHQPSGAPSSTPTISPSDVPSATPSMEPSSAFDNDIGPATGGDYLENSWYMEEPDITYNPDGNWYRLNWTVTGWKDAFETNKHINEDFYDINCKNDGDHTEYRIDNGIIDYHNKLRPMAYKDTWGNIILDFEIIPKIVSTQPEIYSDLGNGTGVLNFCVRSSIGYNGTEDQALNIDQQRLAGYREINFIESLLTIVYDLSSGFTTVTANVKPKDRVGQTETETDSYTLEAWICDTANPVTETVSGGLDNDFTRTYPGPLYTTFEQGSIVPVCIRPDTAAYEEGIVMRDVQQFTWTRGSISQPAIVGGATAPNRLTFHATCDGQDYCILSSILFADFFKTAGVASGNGEARVKFDTPAPGVSGRRLGEMENRLLQEEDASSPFDVNVALNEAQDGPGLLKTAGGASLGLTALASFIALVSAGLLA